MKITASEVSWQRFWLSRQHISLRSEGVWCEFREAWRTHCLADKWSPGSVVGKRHRSDCFAPKIQTKRRSYWQRVVMKVCIPPNEHKIISLPSFLDDHRWGLHVCRTCKECRGGWYMWLEDKDIQGIASVVICQRWALQSRHHISLKREVCMLTYHQRQGIAIAFTL